MGKEEKTAQENIANDNYAKIKGKNTKFVTVIRKKVHIKREYKILINNYT